MGIEEVRQSLDLFYTGTGCMELWFKRLYENGHETKNVGYYDDMEKLASDIEKLKMDKTIKSMYIGLNPIRPDLLAVANNKILLKAPTRSKKEDVIRRAFFFSDVDPKRLPNTSSTDKDHDQCLIKIREINDYMVASMGWPPAMLADSGNGGHPVWKCDLENTPESEKLIDNVQKFITLKLECLKDDNLEIQGFCDANRLIKVYGTPTTKGDEVPALGVMHRYSKIIEVPEPWECVTLEQIKEVSKLYEIELEKIDELDKQNSGNTTANKSTQAPTKNDKPYTGDMTIEKFVEIYNIPVRQVMKESDKTIHLLEKCPFNPDHKDSSLIQMNDGVMGFNCFHDSCKNYHFSDVRELFDPGYKDKSKSINQSIEDDYSLSDYGNARRLIDNYGDNLRYCVEMKNWMIWDNTQWRPDTEGKINQYAKTTITGLYTQLMNIYDPEQRKRFFNFILHCENQSKIKAMVESANNEPGIPISITELDKDLDLINVANGIIDLKTGELIPHDKERLMSRKIDSNYDPSAKCDRFKQFLNETFPDNPEVVSFLKRWLGYSLTGQTGEQVFCIFYGHGSNGKGTLIDTIMSVIGDYAKTTEPETIVKKNTERNSTNDLAALMGARFVTTSETEANAVLDEGRIKRITGQDPITCRFLYQEFFSYIPEYKLVLLTNHEPIIKAQDYSIWRRVLKIPFKVDRPKEQWDTTLRGALLDEKEGILNWMVEGAIEWYNGGLKVPESIKIATEEYKQELDILGDFLEVCTLKNPTSKESMKDIYRFYVKWCEATDTKIWSQNAVSRGLSERGIEAGRTNGLRYKIGIEIRPPLKEKNDIEWFLNALQAQEKRESDACDAFEPSSGNFGQNPPRKGTLHKSDKMRHQFLADSDSGKKCVTFWCEKCNGIFSQDELFNGLCKKCITIKLKDEEERFKTPQSKIEYLTVTANRDIPIFLGVDEKYYSMKNQDMARIPAINAKALIKRNAVRLIGGIS